MAWVRLPVEFRGGDKVFGYFNTAHISAVVPDPADSDGSHVYMQGVTDNQGTFIRAPGLTPDQIFARILEAERQQK